jgi:hypothetical protein
VTTLRSAPRHRVKLGVQSLEARDVPATATILDLSFTGAQVTANSAIVQQTTAVPTSDFDTFLQLQSTNVEEGYNTDARPFQLNQTGDLTVTSALLLADVPVVNIGGIDYRQFFLDVNETTKNPQITLEELRIYLAEAGNLTGYNSKTRTLSGIGAAWDLDGAGNVSVKLNSQLNAGTGMGDAYVYIPSIFFGSSTYVYLYSKLGGKIKSDNGAESWGVLAPAPPPNGSISGFVYFDADNDGNREPLGNEELVNEVGINGVVMHLTGINDLNETVDLFTTTDFNMSFGDGYYEFTGLRPGTYQIVKTADPQDFFDGLNTPGIPPNGQVQESNSQPGVDDKIYNISLGAGAGLVEYDFGELFSGGG